MEHSYPLDGWKITEERFDPAMTVRNETIFTLGNGHIGMRGNFEEGHGNVVSGTYINGFYEESSLYYEESSCGYARNRQVMLNVADGRVIRLSVNGEPFDMSTGRLARYERTLDLAHGVLTRSLRWVSPAGREIELSIRRLVSLARRHVAAIEYTVAAASEGVAIEIESELNGDVTNQAVKDDPRSGTRLKGKALRTTRCESSGTGGLLVQETRESRMSLACAMAHSIEAPRGVAVAVESATGPSADGVIVRLRCALGRGQSLTLTKLIAYCTSRELPEGELAELVRREAAGAGEAGFPALCAEQDAELRRFWSSADVEIEGDLAVQQGLRFNLFSVFQSAGRDGRTSIAAKGLSGEGYEGHYFWDTEIYIMPFFTYTVPEIARALASYRCSILDKAKARAREMSQRGALFPWRTIGGEETSAYFPAGTAQYHINADIVFAFMRYLKAHPDRDLLVEGRGAEMLFETARLWADLGAWLEPRGDERPPRGPLQGGETGGAAAAGERFYINEVTGPDEYTTLVDNNAYTNLMAQHNLEAAVEVAEQLRRTEPAAYARIAASIGLDDEEVEGWRRAAQGMYIPYDRERGLTPQDDLFLKRKRWDFAETPRERYPLLLHYHPLVIYRHQVLKQPDVVLAQVLLGERFSLAEKRRNFDFYDPLTTGDSSLAPCIQGVAAAELGYVEKAYHYFMRTARMDLDDVNGNSADGFHTAAMAGTWLSLVYGFAGMREEGGRLSFNPRLPGQWKRVRFTVRFRGWRLGVEISRDRAVYQIAGDEAGSDRAGLAIRHRGREIALSSEEPLTASLRPALAALIIDLDALEPTDPAPTPPGVRPPDPPASMTPRALRRLLERLHDRGVRTAIVPARGGGDDAAADPREGARRCGIEGIVDLIVDPALLAMGKPDPEPFLAAAELLGLAPEDCAAVGANQAAVDAIKAARMFAIGIGPSLARCDWPAAAAGAVDASELARRFEAYAGRY